LSDLTHIARITPDIEWQLESDYQDTLVNVFCTLPQGMLFPCMTVESRVLPWIIVWGNVSKLDELTIFSE
jgi:hypothetical protein